MMTRKCRVGHHFTAHEVIQVISVCSSIVTDVKQNQIVPTPRSEECARTSRQVNVVGRQVILVSTSTKETEREPPLSSLHDETSVRRSRPLTAGLMRQQHLRPSMHRVPRRCPGNPITHQCSESHCDNVSIGSITGTDGTAT